MDEKDLRVVLARLLEKQDLDSEQIRDLAKKLDNLLQEAIPGLRVEIAMLKVRSGIWGAVAGFLPVALMLLVQFLRG